MILAVSLVIVLQLFSGSLKAGAVSSDFFYGIFRAQEKMEELLVEENPVLGARGGSWEDGYRWEARIEPVSMEKEARAHVPVAGYRIHLSVKWEKGGREREYFLETIKLGPPLDATSPGEG